MWHAGLPNSASFPHGPRTTRSVATPTTQEVKQRQRSPVTALHGVTVSTVWFSWMTSTNPATNLARLCGASSISLAGVPVRLAGRVVGVLSLFKREAELDGSAMGPLGRLSEIRASLAEARILRECLGREPP